jgi:hypothetical protein
MSNPRLRTDPRRRGVHKSTGGILLASPSPVDPVDAGVFLFHVISSDAAQSRTLTARYEP